jgi:hypothetical protein
MIKVQDRTRVKIQLRQSGSASVVDSQSKMEEAIPQTTGNGSAFQSFSEEGQTEGEMKAQLGNMTVAQFNAMWKCFDSRSDNSSTRLSGAAASDNTKPATDISSGSMLNNVNQMSCDGTDDNFTSLPANKITSVYMYDKSQQLAILFALFTVTSPVRVFADSAVATVGARKDPPIVSSRDTSEQYSSMGRRAIDPPGGGSGARREARITRARCACAWYEHRSMCRVCRVCACDRLALL